MNVRWLGAVAAVLLLAAGAHLALQRERGPGLPPPDMDVPGTRTVALLLPDADGELKRETREIFGGELTETDVRRVVEELMAGGASGLRAIPPATRLINVFDDGAGEITLNFSEHLRSDHPGGSEAELATLRSIVASIGANFPGIDRVRILIEGEVVRTLVGHADLSRPLEIRDYH
jgi:spore germination protein GerM